ncbi:MAG: fasciclin domain-containing protein [Acetobacteraceae bacterium]
MKPENKDQLAKVLGYHVLFGRLTTKDLTAEKSAATATIGQPIILEKKGGGAVMAKDARITQPDIAADNGAVQVIDKVLIPAKPVQPKT